MSAATTGTKLAATKQTAARRTRYLAVAAAAATGIFVGSTIVATRFVIGQTTPGALAFLRYTIGFCCLLPPALFAGWPRFARRDLLPLALLGITQFGILIFLLNFALQFIPSARSALIFATMPLLTMLLAAALGHERLTWPKTLGVLLTIGGVALALGEKVAGGDGTAPRWIGAAAVFVSAGAGAICSVLYRPYLRRYPTLGVSAFAMVAAVGFLALLAGREGFFAAWPTFTPGGWLAILFIGVSSGIGYYLWLWALAHSAATNVTVFLALNPITAAALGVLLLGEQLTLLFVIGLCCVALGLWLAHWRSPV